jgi:hypothetical protein
VTWIFASPRDGNLDNQLIMKPANNTLLLTATIKPLVGIPELQRTNPVERMNDYIRALRFYCNVSEKVITRIVFIENSEYDISQLRDLVSNLNASHRVEFLSFNGLDYPPSYGRGYGEFKLLDYAMDHSVTLASAGADTMLWKVTGRYRVLNIVRIVRMAPPNSDLYCDMRTWPIPWVDLRIFGCTLGGYKSHLKGVYQQLREDIMNTAPEQRLYSIIDELAKSHSIVSRFRNEPFIDGIRGKDSKNYASGINLIKYLARSSKRMLFPR